MTIDRPCDECFCADILLRGMAPHEVVLDAFYRETRYEPRTCVATQNKFAKLVQSAWDDKFGPSKSYLRKLVHRFLRSIEQDVEEENLVQLIHLSLTAVQCDVPRADESCYLSFLVSRGDHTINYGYGNTKIDPCCSIRIRIFPHHNDVSLKLWEAGACLAEYILGFPDCVSGKAVLEIGSGVGLTSIVAAGCNAREVHLTDYSDAWRHNVKHNITINKPWINKYGQSDELVMTEGYLNWEEYGESNHFYGYDHVFKKTDVLLAADVAYDVLVIPSLVALFRRFLLSTSTDKLPCAKKLCYLATTLRNKTTYDALERELLARGISCVFVPCSVIETLPKVFPVYFIQKRTEIILCTLSLASTTGKL